MKAVMKKVYRCDFCGKHRFTREGMKRHEKRCEENPKSIKNMMDKGIRWL